MKARFIFLCLGIFFLIAVDVRAEESWRIYHAVAWLSGTDVWQISSNRCTKIPEWKLLDGEPPLSISKAVATAQNGFQPPKRALVMLIPLKFTRLIVPIPDHSDTYIFTQSRSALLLTETINHAWY